MTSNWFIHLTEPLAETLGALLKMLKKLGT